VFVQSKSKVNERLFWQQYIVLFRKKSNVRDKMNTNKHKKKQTCERRHRINNNDIGCAANIGSVDSLTLSPINCPLILYIANENTYLRSGSSPEILTGLIKLAGI
jgi:hypothetical protein